MTEWRSGDITSIAAGLVLGSSVFTPWVLSGATPGPRGDSGLVTFVAVTALALCSAGLLRTSWTALVAFGSAFVVAFVLMTGAIPAHASNAHPGFGLFALGAAGALAVIAGVLNALERQGETF